MSPVRGMVELRLAMGPALLTPMVVNYCNVGLEDRGG